VDARVGNFRHQIPPPLSSTTIGHDRDFLHLPFLSSYGKALGLLLLVYLDKVGSCFLHTVLTVLYLIFPLSVA
jgi:hypothetical protein